MILAIGKKKMTEREYFAREYYLSAFMFTGMWLFATCLHYDDKYDSIAFLVKTGQAPNVSTDSFGHFSHCLLLVTKLKILDLKLTQNIFFCE